MINIIEVKKFPITLAQFLKWCGIAMTGGEAKEIIKCGVVSLNGEMCTMAGKKLEPGDKISLPAEDGEITFMVSAALDNE